MAAGSTDTPTRERENERGSAGWWWPLAWGIGVIALLLLIFTQCVGDDEDAAAAPTTTAAPLVEVEEQPTPEIDLELLAGALAQFGFGDLGFDVDGTTITLTGEVDAEQARLDAELVALSIPGVTAVDNQLTVRPPAVDTVDPDAVGSALAVAGHPTVAFSLDGTTVVLTGEVASNAERDAAEAAALAVPGVAAVDNRLTVAAAGPGTLAEVAADAGTFSTLLAAAEAAGLVAALSGEVPLTILAPTDAAFDALPAGAVEALLADRERLIDVLSGHIVAGVADSGAVAAATEVVTLSGAAWPVTADDDALMVGDATVTAPDIPAANGLIHVIDTVLLTEADLTLNVILDLEPITFEAGSSVITAEGRAVLDRAVEYFTANNVAVEIAGHTDSDGSEATNLALSQRRADAVRQYLIDNGVDEELVTAVGYGESQPVADNATPEGRAENRRIEFRL
jgi:outer membrane protein OmpA-like peptidoglycan-associated protein